MEPEFSALSLYLPSLPAGSPLPDTITLKQRWEEAEEVFREVQSVQLQLLVIFGGTEEEQRCLMATAVVTEVCAVGGRTRITFQNYRPSGLRPLFPCLRDVDDTKLEEDVTGEPQIVATPSFVFEGPKTFLLTWKPEKRVNLEQFNELEQQLVAGETCSWEWTCRSVNKVRAGDRFLMLRLGTAPRGIIGSGLIRSDGWFSADDEPYVDILWERLVDPTRPLDPGTIQGTGKVHWSPQGSGIELPEEACEAVWKAWQAYDGGGVRSANSPRTYPAAAPTLPTAPIEDAASSQEGRLIESWSSRRERDPANRALCLAAHGYHCAVCAMSFAEEYGEIGEGFIHIHHENPLAASDDESGALHCPEVTMKPVCPNCHAMLHRGQDATRGEVRSIAELKALRAEALAAKG